jgi:hypothetical protein
VARIATEESEGVVARLREEAGDQVPRIGGVALALMLCTVGVDPEEGLACHRRP